MFSALAPDLRLLARVPSVLCHKLRDASSLRVASCDLQRGAVFLRKGIYCEVRSSKPAGHGRSADGAFEIRYRELRTRKAREMKLKATETLDVVECERVAMPVMYKDDNRLVLADAEFNEVEVAMQQLGDAGEVLECGHTVSVLYHEGNLVKVIPPPDIADQLQADYRKQRRSLLASRQTERKELKEKRAFLTEEMWKPPAASNNRFNRWCDCVLRCDAHIRGMLGGCWTQRGFNDRNNKINEYDKHLIQMTGQLQRRQEATVRHSVAASSSCRWLSVSLSLSLSLPLPPSLIPSLSASLSVIVELTVFCGSAHGETLLP